MKIDLVVRSPILDFGEVSSLSVEDFTLKARCIRLIVCVQTPPNSRCHSANHGNHNNHMIIIMQILSRHARRKGRTASRMGLWTGMGSVKAALTTSGHSTSSIQGSGLMDSVVGTEYRSARIRSLSFLLTTISIK
jgi:hypothetical protein